jgi:hypothetical protein
MPIDGEDLLSGTTATSGSGASAASAAAQSLVARRACRRVRFACRVEVGIDFRQEDFDLELQKATNRVFADEQVGNAVLAFVRDDDLASTIGDSCSLQP